MRKILSNFILIVLVIILCYVWVLKYVYHKSVVMLGNYGILVVMSGSMEPEIKAEELILIKKSDKYNLDDIVTYVDSEDVLITHRIVEIDNEKFISRGDSNQVVDENVDINEIQGKVIYHSKFLGKLILYYLKFIILVWIILLLIVAMIRILKGDKGVDVEEDC